MKNLLLVIFTGFLLITCQRDHKICFTPPSPIYFKFIDAATGNNLIANGSLNPANFSVVDQFGKKEQFMVITENNLNAVQVGIGWFNGIKNYKFTLSETQYFRFDVKSYERSGNCGGYVVEEIKIINQEFSQEANFYLIKL